MVIVRVAGEPVTLHERLPSRVKDSLPEMQVRLSKEKLKFSISRVVRSI
jgi:hypothetical protein